MNTPHQALEHRTEPSRLENVSGICLRLALLFGSAALALLLILVPSQREQSWFNPHYDPGIEFLATGSITPRLPVASSRAETRNNRESFGCILDPSNTKGATC